MLAEPFVTDSILLIVGMLSAVDFDNKTTFAANEIDDIRTNRLLPDEFRAERIGAKAIP